MYTCIHVYIHTYIHTYVSRGLRPLSGGAFVQISFENSLFWPLVFQPRLLLLQGYLALKKQPPPLEPPPSGRAFVQISVENALFWRNVVLARMQFVTSTGAPRS